MDLINTLAFTAGSYIVFHPVRSLTAYLTLLTVAVGLGIWAHVTDRRAS